MVCEHSGARRGLAEEAPPAEGSMPTAAFTTNVCVREDAIETLGGTTFPSLCLVQIVCSAMAQRGSRAVRARVLSCAALSGPARARPGTLRVCVGG